MYSTLINIHVWTSTMFLLISIVLCSVVFRDFYYKKRYSKMNNRLEIAFIGFLYFSMILGIVLYFFLDPTSKPKMLSLDEAQKYASLRFWAIEHFCVMLFAVILSQIGRIFTSRNISANHKHKYALFYYGMATLITFISTLAYLINKEH